MPVNLNRGIRVILCVPFVITVHQLQGECAGHHKAVPQPCLAELGDERAPTMDMIADGSCGNAAAALFYDN